MKIALLLVVIAVAWVFWRRIRRPDDGSASRPSSFFGTGTHAINVRLLSEEQVDALDRDAKDE